MRPFSILEKGHQQGRIYPIDGSEDGGQEQYQHQVLDVDPVEPQQKRPEYWLCHGEDGGGDDPGPENLIQRHRRRSQCVQGMVLEFVRYRVDHHAACHKGGKDIRMGTACSGRTMSPKSRQCSNRSLRTTGHW